MNKIDEIMNSPMIELVKMVVAYLSLITLSAGLITNPTTFGPAVGLVLAVFIALCAAAALITAYRKRTNK